MPRLTRVVAAAAALALAGALAACGPEDTKAGGAPSTLPSGSALACSPTTLQTKVPGTLTVGTDKPAYPPYFQDNDPSNGKGFESAVAYAVAAQLGYTTDQVKWTVVPFNSSYAPGAKDFDFDINQISITDARKKVVDFSDGYYDVSQAVVALKGSKGAAATSIADLKQLKLGAQVGTTSLSYVQNVVQPTQQPGVFDDTNAAKNALENGQLDAIVVDLPTAYYITAAEIENSVIVGQFPAESGAEQFGMLFEKGSPLVPCVDQALAALKSSGQLTQITDQWLGAGAGVPTFQ